MRLATRPRWATGAAALVIVALVLGCGTPSARRPGGDAVAGGFRGVLTTPTPAPPPRGMFALSAGTRAVPTRVLNDPGVDGVSLRATWMDVEPDEGRLTWTFDGDIERARKAGRKVMLRVTPGHRTPAWVYAAGAETFEFVDMNPNRRNQLQTLTIPVPWDPIFLARWTAFVRALGERYAKDPTVVIVHMAGPAKTSAEMHLPKTAADKDRWRQIGYSASRLTQAWKTVIAAYADAFPVTYLALNIATPVYDDGVLEDVVAYARETLGGRLCLQHNALAARTNPGWRIHELVASHRGWGPVGFQLLTAEGPRLGGPLADALRIGLDAGASYFEIYPADLENAVAGQAIRDVAAQLRSAGS